MRVALFSRYPVDTLHPRGGVEAVTVVLVKALARLPDLEVHVVTLERACREVAVERDGAVAVHRLPGSSWPQLLDILAGPGRRRLINYVMGLKPDILHLHETYGLTLGLMSIPCVFTIHGFDHANLIANAARFGWVRARLWKHVERRGLAMQRHIISITPYVRAMIESQTGARIYDIDNPVDERFFRVLRRPEPGRVLCVGWINERKNTLGAVEAFAGIARHDLQAKLVIAGEPQEAEYFHRVRQSIARHGLDARVELLGTVDHTRLLQELARASILLLPSRQENAPMAIAEAMAVGIPVVASNRCGMPYMIQEGQSGFLIDPEATEQITDRLARLIDSPLLCHQMGQTGQRVALERFHPRVVAEKTRAVYERVCTAA